jgi:hypothetical protein
VEGSLDGVAWVEIDRQTDTKVFKGGNLKNEVFSVARPVECRLLRLTQTGKDHKGQNRLRLQWVDFFGSFAVALDTLLAEIQQQTSGMKARCGGIESAIAKVRGSVASLEREVDRSAVSFPMRAPKSRDGIIAYLTKKHDGDVQETTIVSVTSRSLSEDRKYALTGVTNLASNSWPRFYSQDWSCQWVRWDFQDLRIRPTHYTVRSILLKSWVIEGSRDDWGWTEIDRRTNTGAFRQLSTASFTVANPGKFRFIRLTQTGENHAGDDRLCLVGVEFFGTLFE